MSQHLVCGVDGFGRLGSIHEDDPSRHCLIALEGMKREREKAPGPSYDQTHFSLARLVLFSLVSLVSKLVLFALSVFCCQTESATDAT